jgi:PAS domain S-box-containing protein
MTITHQRLYKNKICLNFSRLIPVHAYTKIQTTSVVNRSFHREIILRVSFFSANPIRLPLIIGVIGFLITLLCGYQMHINHKRKVVEHFQSMAESTLNQVSMQLQPYAAGLRGARGVVLGAGGPTISREKFQSYIASRDLEVEFPGLRGFGFIRIVKAKDEKAFIAKVRAEGFPQFNILQITPHNGDRYVIEYIEPLSNNQAAMGLDIASEPKRREAAHMAMLSNKPTITEPVTLLQANHKTDAGFLILLPVFSSNSTGKLVDNSATKPQKVFAWVYAPVVIDEILEGINDKNNEIGVAISDVKSNKTFYRSYDRDEKALQGFHFQKHINVAEREWSFSFVALPAFSSQLNAPEIYLTVIAMLLITLMLSGFFYQLFNTQQRDIQIRVDQQKRLRLRTIIDAVPCGILVMDSYGRMREVNEGLCVMLGYDRDSLLEQSLKIILPERYLQNRPHLIAELLQQAHDQPEGANIVFKALCQTGAELPVSVDFKQMHDGKEITLIATWIDVSERRKQERQLREYAELQRAMLANAGYAIIAFDENGLITVFNPAAEKMLGFSAQEVVGKQTVFMFHDENEVYARTEQLSKELQETIAVGFETLVIKAKMGLADVNEWTYIRQDGSRFPVLLTVSCLLQENGEILGFLGIAADLTEQKRVEEQYLLAVEAAEAAALTKSEFLANMSHEIRTPMNGIVGMTAITLETQLSPVQREYLTLVQDSANYLLQLINDILDFSKMESGKLKLSPIDFQIRDFIKKRLKVLEEMAKQKQIELLVEVNEAVPNWLHGDPDRWMQVLINFISNAIKFTKTGSVKLVINIAESESSFPDLKDKIMLHCNVIDTGIGIPLIAQQQIFEAFSQADASITRRFGGTGLGLSICKQINDLMGGRILVESEPGVGSQFQFFVPFERASIEGQMAEELAELDQVLAANKAVRPLNVLLAEDHPVNQKIVIEILTYRGHRVSLAENGYQVLELYAQNVFDLILMDIQMPGMDGETATTAIRLLERETGTHVRIIGLTAHALVGDKERLLKIGMDGYLSKPFMPQELIQQVEIYTNTEDSSSAGMSEAMPISSVDIVPELPIFDRQEALDRAMGDVNFLKKLSALFIETLPEMRNDLQKAVDQLDALSVEHVAHRIKGSVANFSAAACVDVAKKIEYAAEAKDWPAIQDLIQQWDQQIALLVNLLKQLD